MPPRSGGGSGCIPGPREGASAPPNARGHGDVKTPLSSWGFSSFEVDLSISTGCCPGHSLHLRFKASHRSLPSSSVWQRCSQRDEMMHSSCRAAASASEEDHIRFFREERGLFSHTCVCCSLFTRCPHRTRQGVVGPHGTCTAHAATHRRDTRRHGPTHTAAEAVGDCARARERVRLAHMHPTTITLAPTLPLPMAPSRSASRGRRRLLAFQSMSMSMSMSMLSRGPAGHDACRASATACCA